MKKSFITGFTLAEVLITLTVIGVIAALTIPALIQNIQDAQYHAAWKETFSVLNQATQKVLLDAGGDLKGYCTGADGVTPNQDCLLQEYLKYLNYSKSCTFGTSRGNCWHNSINFINNVSTNWYDTSGIILNNGMLLEIAYENSTCSVNRGNLLGCGWIIADVNGFKGPNTFGKDIYFTWILKDKIVPVGMNGDGFEDYCVGSTGWGAGWGCSAKFLYQ